MPPGKPFAVAGAGSGVALDRDEVHQVEHRAQVDREAFLALPDEHATRHVAARDVHRVDERARVGLVVGHAAEGLGADEVIGLAEHRAAIAAGHLRDIAEATVAAGHPHLVALAEIQVGVVGRAHAADVLQRHRNIGAGDVELEAAVVVGQPVVEAELEGEVFFRVTVVVDVDLVQRRRVQGEIVRTAVRLLQRDVVGEQRDVAVPAGFVAVEEIEVGRVLAWVARDIGRFPMAGP